MRTTTDTRIVRDVPALIEAARAYKRCGDYSQAHPTTPLKDNPYERETRRQHRKAFGRLSILWGCSACRVMFPLVTAECEGHESLAGEHMGSSVQCEGCDHETLSSACCDAELFFDVG